MKVAGGNETKYDMKFHIRQISVSHTEVLQLRSEFAP